MAHNPKFSVLAVNTKADAVGALANSGKLAILDGSQPATADSPITTQGLLATLTMNAVAFQAAVSGLITANPITATIATGTGVPTWFRLYEADNVTVICDGSAGTSSNFNLVVSASPIVALANVSAVSFTIQELRG